jgi:hypothetical protein
MSMRTASPRRGAAVIDDRSSRRALLERAVAAGRTWSTPVLLSTPAHATMSAGARTMRGPFRSLKLAWDPSGWQTRPGTGRSPAQHYFRTRRLDVNGGGGWKLLSTGQTVDLQAGSSLHFRMPPLDDPAAAAVAEHDTGHRMMVDLTAAATVSIGDRFGFFTVIDGRSA